MLGITIKLDGLDELIRGLRELPTEIEKELESALNESAQMVLDRALLKVPIKSGELKNSLKIKRAKKNGKGFTYASMTFSNPKGVPAELGHRLISHGKIVGVVKEHPFMRPAFDEVKDEAESKIIEGSNRAFDNMGGIK